MNSPSSSSQKQGIERSLNQDFVVPAPSNIPIEVVSVRVRRYERMKEFEGGRRPTTGRSRTKGEMNRQISLESEQTRRTEPSIRSVGEERMIILLHSKILRRDCHFVEELVNLERRSNNDRPNVEQRYL